MKVAIAALPSFSLVITASPQVSISTDENYRYIHSNAIPSHSTGSYTLQIEATDTWGNTHTSSQVFHRE